MQVASSHNATAGEREFLAERDTVCEEFATHEGQRRKGQLSRVEYLIVGLLVVATFVITLVIQ
ncbi:hypothetical protein [Glutamicibacter sp. NPDC087673]|uniref:hypothetical protein n=1 Tax=Glutamicibacter sp. NPDC087673 TaxID=3363997 RepID=UPI003815427E